MLKDLVQRLGIHLSVVFESMAVMEDGLFEACYVDLAREHRAPSRELDAPDEWPPPLPDLRCPVPDARRN